MGPLSGLFIWALLHSQDLHLMIKLPHKDTTSKYHHISKPGFQRLRSEGTQTFNVRQMVGVRC